MNIDKYNSEGYFDPTSYEAIGMVNDMFAESRNDEYPYREIVGQNEFDNF